MQVARPNTSVFKMFLNFFVQLACIDSEACILQMTTLLRNEKRWNREPGIAKTKSIKTLVGSRIASQKEASLVYCSELQVSNGLHQNPVAKKKKLRTLTLPQIIGTRKTDQLTTPF